jgi:hypothetical protein
MSGGSYRGGSTLISVKSRKWFSRSLGKKAKNKYKDKFPPIEKEVLKRSQENAVSRYEEMQRVEQFAAAAEKLRASGLSEADVWREVDKLKF